MGVAAGALVCVFSIGVATGSAQSLGDIARQEREKRRQRCVSRVLTNDDLSRAEILSDQDRACLEAAREALPARAGAPAPFSANAEIRPLAGEAPPIQPVVPPFHLDSLIFPYQSALPDFPLAEIAPYDREMKAVRLAREAQLHKTVVARVPPGRSRRHLAAPAPGIAPSIPQFRLEPVVFDAGLPPAPFAPSPPSDTTTVAPTRVEKIPPVRVVLPTAADGSDVESGIPSAVRVERGDSLWKIAERHLGKGRAWRKIAAANPHIGDPNVIHAGDVLELPAEVSGVAAEADSVEGAAGDSSQVRVERGDTLWALARTQFGRGTAWTCIAQANQLRNPDLILPGQTLTLPASCPATP